jgi:hypothetical protein
MTLTAGLALALNAHGVSVNPDGVGQALIYPYYTVRSAAGNPFNTYLTVVNHTANAKALRVRLREGRLSKETLSVNLFLGPNDAWAAAIVPFEPGARLITLDSSCTDPGFAVDFIPGGLPYVQLRTDAFSGGNADGAGTDAARVREGFVEIIEMATLAGASATAATHTAGVPGNCELLRGSAVSVAAPTGGISDTLTLINVASGMDFTVNAEALASLGTRAFYRPASDPYPDFAATEIDSVSLIVANGKAYRSLWSRPVDAVSAAMMRDRWMFEYVLDVTTRSLTDVVATFPTRQFYTTATQASAPFTQPASWAANCLPPSLPPRGEVLNYGTYNREEGALLSSCDSGLCPTPTPRAAACAAAAVASVVNGASHMPQVSGVASAVLGSTTQGLGDAGRLDTANMFQNGWVRIAVENGPVLTSLPGSTRIDLATGTQTAGSHQLGGLPVVGMAMRIFQNGTLVCSAGSCQGNYGGAFPLKYERTVTP